MSSSQVRSAPDRDSRKIYTTRTDARHALSLSTDYLKSKGTSSQDPPLPTFRRRNKTSRCATSQATTSSMSTATRCSTSLPRSPGQFRPVLIRVAPCRRLDSYQDLLIADPYRIFSFVFPPRSIAIGYNNPELLALAKTVSCCPPRPEATRPESAS